MSVRNAQIRVRSFLRTGITLLCLWLPAAARSEIQSPLPPAASATESRSGLPTEILLDQTVHVPQGATYGTGLIVNNGVIWGSGTLIGRVQNDNQIITGETRPDQVPYLFDVPDQKISKVSGAAMPRWLQFGRIAASESLTVKGDYAQDAGGSLFFALGPGGNSQLKIDGSLTRLDGSIELDFAGIMAGVKGPLRPTYTLIDAGGTQGGGLSGTPTVLIANDNGQWGYRITETDNGKVLLTLDPLKYFHRQAGTQNQDGVAQLFDKVIPKASGALYNALNALYQLPKPRLQDTLTRLNGELHAETPDILYSSVADAWNPVYARMGMSASQGGYVEGGDPHLWMSGLGSFGGVEGNLNATGYQQHSAGTLIGADTRFLDFLNAGLTAGYLSTGANRSGIDNTLNSNLWQIGTYTDLAFGTNGHFGILIGYDQGSTSTRNATVLGVSSGAGEARLITAEAIGSWRHDLGGGHSLTPIVALQSITTQHSGVTETGLSALGAATGSFSSNYVSARVQARYDYVWQALGADWVSSVAVGLREMINQPLPAREISIIGTGGDALLVRGVQGNGQTGAGLINAGLTGHLGNAFDLEFGYRGIYTGTASLSSFQGNLVWNYDAPKVPRSRNDQGSPAAIENPEAAKDQKDPLTIREPGADMANYPNSAYTLPEGGFYLEATPYSYTARSQALSPPTMAGQTLFRYGLIENVELRLFYSPYEIQNMRKGTVSGSGPLTFDTKIHLWDEWEEYFVPAAGFELTIQTPWMASTAFQSRTSPGFSFNFDQQIPFDIAIEYNIGAVQFEDPKDLSQNVWQLAAQWAAQRDITDDVAVFFNGYYNRTTLPRVSHHVTETRTETRYNVICTESGAQQGHTICQDVAHIINVPYTVRVPLEPLSSVPVVMGGGVIWTLNDHVQLFGNAAAGITQGSPSLQTYVGFAWTP